MKPKLELAGNILSRQLVSAPNFLAAMVKNKKQQSFVNRNN